MVYSSVGEEGRVKLQAIAVSKRKEREAQVCLYIDKPGSPTKCGIRYGERVS